MALRALFQLHELGEAHREVLFRIVHGYRVVVVGVRTGGLLLGDGLLVRSRLAQAVLDGLLEFFSSVRIDQPVRCDRGRV